MIPFVDLRAQYLGIKGEIDEAVGRVLQSAEYILGREVAAFEQDFARYCDVAHAVGTSSGTSALHVALLSSGVGPGDEVVTVPFTFVATAAAIRYCGARPVFVDIDPSTYTLDVAQLERAITPRTRAVVPVHLYGHPADMDPILEIADRHGVAVIEDAAQAHGAEYQGRRVGSIGARGCFSFYPAKNLGACGTAGAVTTGDAAAAQDMCRLRNWGQARGHHREVLGFNYRMDGLQGAILRVKLAHLETWTARRRALALRYDDLLGPALRPHVRPRARHVYHLYVVRLPERDRIAESLRSHGIQTAVSYPVPVHLQPTFRDLGYRPGAFPEAERAAAEVLSLPLYAEMPDAAVEEVASTVRRLLA